MPHHLTCAHGPEVAKFLSKGQRESQILRLPFSYIELFPNHAHIFFSLFRFRFVVAIFSSGFVFSLFYIFFITFVPVHKAFKHSLNVRMKIHVFTLRLWMRECGRISPLKFHLFKSCTCKKTHTKCTMNVQALRFSTFSYLSSPSQWLNNSVYLIFYTIYTQFVCRFSCRGLRIHSIVFHTQFNSIRLFENKF